MSKTLKDITKFEKIWLAVLISSVILGLYWGFTNPDFFTNYYLKEDGVIEYATVLFLIGSCLTVFRRWKNYRKQHVVRFGLISWIVILAFFFVAGEEVSWGQRIFQLETSEYFKENNAQEELNLHNLTVGEVKINKLVFGLLLTTAILIYMILVPLLYHKVKSIKKFLDFWYIPIPKLRHSLAYLLLLGLISIIPPGKKWELLEFGSVLIFMLILLYPFNKPLLEPENSL